MIELNNIYIGVYYIDLLCIKILYLCQNIVNI